jgi:hypothetical protein
MAEGGKTRNTKRRRDGDENEKGVRQQPAQKKGVEHCEQFPSF